MVMFAGAVSPQVGRPEDPSGRQLYCLLEFLRCSRIVASVVWNDSLRLVELAILNPEREELWLSHG
jgi:hypothetical protein